MNSQGQFDYEYNVDLNFVLNQSTPLTLAVLITHEVWHLRRLQDYLALNPVSIEAEKVSTLDSYFKNKTQILVEEAFAYGREAEGYIHQAGLLGRLYGVAISGQENRAAKFILYGKNVDGLEWKNYIASLVG